MLHEYKQWPVYYLKLCFVCCHVNAVVNCGQLQAPTNGIVRVSGSTEGSTATYSCISGYSLVGNILRQCQSNGEWSGTQPFCERDSKLYSYRYHIHTYKLRTYKHITYINTYIHTYNIHTYIHTNTYIHTYILTYIHTYIHTFNFVKVD